MSSSTINSSLGRSRSLRSNSLKPMSSLNPQSPAPAPGPSNITLFLTNLRLLELDTLKDWPGITGLTFSTSSRQENQRKRIQCVEWALFQLFALWDPEETRNKLQPFFPPLEPLQSLNLRAALLRCLDQVKKTGVLGRDTVLRKTMLDECKGERLDEVLAVFSSAVLKSLLQEDGSEQQPAIAQRLAFENFSYTGERTVLSTLILAHKASLRKHLDSKENSRAKYHDFSDLLDLNDRRIARRHEQLKEAVKESGPQQQLPSSDVRDLQDLVRRNWSGSDDWLETILRGDSRFHQDGLLATSFDRVWKHVERSTIGDLEGMQDVGLLEQVDARVRSQDDRLARWQDFGKTLSKALPGPPSTKLKSGPNEVKINLRFSQHGDLQVGCSTTGAAPKDTSNSLDGYTRILENLQAELSNIAKPQVRSARPPRQSLGPEKPLAVVSSPITSKPESTATRDEEWSSVSESDEPSPGFNATKSTSQTPPSEIMASELHTHSAISAVSSSMPPTKIIPALRNKVMPERTQRPETVRQMRTPPPEPVTRKFPPAEVPQPEPQDSESDLADQILNSIATTSPSPKKQRHTLSLAERTRLSMSRTSLSQFSDIHEEYDNLADLPRLFIRPKTTQRNSMLASFEEEKHADLIERTRKSMAGFEAAQKKAQLERRRSMKNAKKKSRESSYFPRVEEDEVPTPQGIDKQEMMEGDPDYESVFKSRPKIALSPAISPRRSFVDDRDE